MVTNPNGRVLFIVHDVYQEDNDFPLGYAYLAAVLKEEGCDVTICCQDIFHHSDEEVAELFLKNQDYDLIGVGFLAARFNETVLGLCRTLNKYKKDAWLVLGGPGPSPIPEYMIQETNADIVVMGEAEDTTRELLKCKLESGDLSKIKSIAYQDNGEIIVNERRKPVKHLDSIPLPEWSLFPMERYTTCVRYFNHEPGDRTLVIITSRGCINECSFCYRMEKGIRIRSADSVVEEMRLLNENYGVNSFFIADEMFITSKKRVFNFQEALEKSGLKIKFFCSARVDIMDEESVDSMKETGCQLLSFGMESSDQKVLDLMNKNATVEENIRAAEITKKAGIGSGLNFIWGLPGDTEKSLKGNVELIKEYNSYYQIRTIRPPTPFPGSDLYYEAIEKDLFSGPGGFFDKFKNSDLLTVNFTDIPDDEYYKLLFEANKSLITDHFEHTTKDIEAADRLINDFYNLYFKGYTKFRGARHYTKEDPET